MNYGGMAKFDGVMFHSDDVEVIARRVKDKIVVTDDVDLDKYEYSENDTFDIDYLLSKIPIIRGVWDLLKILSKSWKMYLILFLLLGGYFLIFGNVKHAISITFDPLKYALVTAPVVVLIVFKITQIGKYHAAEHMASNCYNQGKDLTIKNTIIQSRIHKDCGTNLAIFICLILTLMTYTPSTQGINMFLKLIISWSIAYELFVIENKIVKRVLLPVYLIGYSFQYLFFTSKPTEKHIEVAIVSLKRMVKLQNKIDKLH